LYVMLFGCIFLVIDVFRLNTTSSKQQTGVLAQRPEARRPTLINVLPS
jgi:hypothetical protein